MNRKERRLYSARLRSPRKAAAVVNRGTTHGHIPGSNPNDVPPIEAKVTQRAMKRLRARIQDPAFGIPERFPGDPEAGGNRLSEDHDRALYCLIGRYAALANRRVTSGRLAYALVPGAGKSLSIACFVAECAAMKLGWSVLIAAGRIEELFKMRARLIAEDVNAEDIAIWYSTASAKKAHIRSHPDFAERTEPAEDGTFRKHRILLVSHAFVHAQKDAERLNAYEKSADGRRDWAAWDEAMFVSRPWAMSLTDLQADFRSLQERLNAPGREHLLDRQPLLREAMDFLATTLRALSGPDEQCLCDFAHKADQIPALNSERREALIYALRSLKRQGWVMRNRSGIVASLVRLIENSQLPLRVVYGLSGGPVVVRYDVIVPASLQRVAVLDASFPVRTLKSLDPTIQLDPTFHGDFKDYAPVRVHVWDHASGEDALTRDFNRREKDERVVSREVVALFTKAADGSPASAERPARIAEDASVLIYVHKGDEQDIMSLTEGEDDDSNQPRSRKAATRRTIRDILEEDLSAAGVSMKDSQGRQRIYIDTLGRHDGTNDFSHVEHVIILGFIHKPFGVLAAWALGEANDLQWDGVDQTLLEWLQLGEVSTILHQAGSRGRGRYSRPAEEGTGSVAFAQHIWCLYSDPRRLLDHLGDVMPGIDVSEPWIPHGDENVRKMRATKLNARVTVAAQYLQEQEGRLVIGSRLSLKDVNAALTDRAPLAWGLTFKQARAEALDCAIELRRSKGHLWNREERSLVYEGPAPQ